jgi:hypothetical protein
MSAALTNSRLLGIYIIGAECLTTAINAVVENHKWGLKILALIMRKKINKSRPPRQDVRNKVRQEKPGKGGGGMG